MPNGNESAGPDLNQHDCKQHVVVWMVVGTLGIIAIVCVVTLSVCAIRNIDPPPKVIETMKDIGLVALTAVASLLSRTRFDPPPPPTTTTISTPPTTTTVSTGSDAPPPPPVDPPVTTGG